MTGLYRLLKESTVKRYKSHGYRMVGESEIIMKLDSLSNLNDRYQNIKALALDSDIPIEAVESALKEVEGDITLKVQNGIGLIKDLEGLKAHIESEKRRYTEAYNALDNRIKRIKEWYKINLERMEKAEVQTSYGKMKIANNGGVRTMEIVNPEVIPVEYLTVIPEHTEPNKEAIRAALEEGKTVAGAYLKERGTHLVIR